MVRMAAMPTSVRRTRSNDAGKSERPGRTHPFSGTNATSKVPPALETMWMRAASRKWPRKPAKNSCWVADGRSNSACCQSAVSASNTATNAAVARMARFRRRGSERNKLNSIARSSLRQRAGAPPPARPGNEQREAGHEDRHEGDVDEGEEIAERIDVLAQIVLNVAQ